VEREEAPPPKKEIEFKGAAEVVVETPKPVVKKPVMAVAKPVEKKIEVV
jgi:hypothetical protein